jgi:mRNA-degrading endonuclease RelE of RelBE toxin-antitoxin system
MKKPKYAIYYSDEVYSHLQPIDRKYWPFIKRKIKEQLAHAPDSETTNRKPLSKPPVDNRWELRCGPHNCFRIFYKIDYIHDEVHILAIGTKVKERLYIGKKEIKL